MFNYSGSLICGLGNLPPRTVVHIDLRLLRHGAELVLEPQRAWRIVVAKWVDGLWHLLLPVVRLESWLLKLFGDLRICELVVVFKLMLPSID